MTERSDLIAGLANAMGFNTVGNELTRHEASYYDKGTGTLYCNGMAITKNVANEAVKFFESLEKQYLSDTHENKKVAMFYRTAIEAISLLETEEGKDFAKNIVNKFEQTSKEA